MKTLRTGLLVGLLVLAAPAAYGQFFQDLFRGFQIASTPSSGPLFTGPGGSRTDGQRLGRTRIVPNILGRGYRFEFDRRFGSDQLGRPEIFNFGNLEVELSGSTSTTAEFTRRGIPTGKLDFTVTGMNYSIRGLTGLEDVTLSGTLNVNNQLRVNPLGFYTYTLNVNNTGSTLEANGLAVDGLKDTNFDIGPISVKGNIFFDATVALLASFGVDTSQVVGAFPMSPVDRIVEEIQTSLAKQATDLRQQVFQPDGAPATAVSGGSMTVGELIDAGRGRALLGEDFSIELELVGATDGPTRPNTPTGVPEPATLALLAAAGLLVVRRRVSRPI